MRSRESIGVSVPVEKLLYGRQKPRPRRGGRVMQQQPKKQAFPSNGMRGLEAPRKAAVRPIGMQEMGPTLYEQLRRALVELTPVSSN
ncbi:hypothetical protein MXAN_5725 [Myxococcus xanthus DK 1622]|uniref:Uncharacterized protein n=2 Tax=Myxococcaceae TaxID=31 RepID=Q1D0G0_MYXXD|nr:hypothetical protein MXAN_5725 [Myxococcus xanthus DK 1622]